MKSIVAILITGLLLGGCLEDAIQPTRKIPCSGGVPDPGFTHQKEKAFQALIDHYVQLGLPGVSVLIEDSAGVWAGSAGFADLEQQIPFTPCQISKVASITKMMMGALTFKLQEEGSLSIDDPISKYIDVDILKKITNAEGKTIRQLMNHTTGIYDVINSSEFYLAALNHPNKEWKALELLKFVYGQPGVALNKPYPASYSNTNTLLLSMCIETATGGPHDVLLRKKVIEPLGMTSTWYQGREKIPNNAAQGYYDLHNNGTIVNVSNIITGSGNGFGGIYSNVFDLQKLINALFRDTSYSFLSKTSIMTMQEFLQEEEDFFTGVGLIKKFTSLPSFGIGHTGRDLGYVADAFYFPAKGFTMIFFVNYGTDGDSPLKPVFQKFERELAELLIQ